MQLNSFNGGLSIRLEPSLIANNEAVIYTNIDNSKGILASINGIKDENQEVRGYFYKFKGSWLSSYLERSYVEYKNYLYFSEKDKEAKKYDGTRETKLGISAPVVKLTTTQTDPSDANVISDQASVLQYTYTYYNSIDDIESAPAPISNELNLPANKVVTISNVVASVDGQVDKIKIYRISTGITTMTLVATVSNTSDTYLDTATNLELPGALLDSYDNYPPIIGIKYLTEVYGILFGAIGTSLYFTKIGKPNAWPATNQISFSEDIVGLLPVSDGLLVHSENKTYILKGTKISDFAVLPVSSEQGSVSHYSGKTIKSIPIWISKEGICSYSSGTIQVISKDKLDTIKLPVVNTIVKDEQYFICLTDGNILVMDARYSNTIYKTLVFEGKVLNLAESNGVLYCSINDRLKSMFTGEPLELVYKSPLFTEGNHTNTKQYNNIYIRADGEFSVYVYLDGEEVHYTELKDKKLYDVKIPAEQQHATDMQLLIRGIGKIHEIEWKVVGRQNGR